MLVNLYICSMTYRVDILNPKAEKLLQELADLELIVIAYESDDPFLAAVNIIREKSSPTPPTLEDITREVEVVRTKCYAKSWA